jgi:nudix-type nucleoside diphosphatase (YffH/AdpP family)
MIWVALPGEWQVLAGVAGAEGTAGGVALDAVGTVRLDAALAALGYRRVPVPGTETWAIAPACARPEVALRDGRLDDPVFLAEFVEEAADLLAACPPEAAERIAALVVPRAWARRRGRAMQPTARLRAARSGGVERVALARPYGGFFAVEEHRLRHRRFDGTMSPAIDRAVFASGDAATVLPWDPVRDRVLLIEQFRASLVARRDPLPWCLEAVAGRCDGAETPEATVRREAEEEAGLVLGRVERIAAYYTSPGLSCEFITAFVGEAALDGEEGVFGCADEDEDIRAFVVPRARAMQAMAEGEIDNAPLILSLQWLALHAERLRAAWQHPG